MTTTKHLWDHEHPHYCEHGNFYSRGLATGYESWAEFSRPVTYDRSGPQLIQDGRCSMTGIRI
ncbi:hypothetical protein IV500_05645 [Paeniglutamicibacter antarcticus]|uniref:Uncharacterized protein n=1 Tax=Arthrobacter terrae TaxID=2935737 RepID=A0A931CMJ1_9MICC|nr:hypothetical protein [Arthrobacter terrae]MBG0738905.1 hypothetical protein [Arthrobacter terrae]